MVACSKGTEGCVVEHGECRVKIEEQDRDLLDDVGTWMAAWEQEE